jgi:hypothetical protein
MANFQFWSPDAVTVFERENQKFFDGSSVLQAAIAEAFQRNFSSPDHAAVLIFFLGLRCVDDFRQVGLLASNGHGWGSTAHLRGMYERAVVSTYLRDHPEEADAFVEYDIVRRWRTAQKIKETFNVSAESDADLATLERQYREVVDQFRVTACEKCKTKRINHIWSKLDFVTMASSVGTLGRAIVPAYYMPLAQAHATFASAAYGLAERHDGSFYVDPKTNAAEARRSFQFAHLIMLGVLTLQHEYFGISSLDAPLGESWNHYKVTWGVTDPPANIAK